MMYNLPFRFHGITDPHNLIDSIIISIILSGLTYALNRAKMDNAILVGCIFLVSRELMILNFTLIRMSIFLGKSGYRNLALQLLDFKSELNGRADNWIKGFKFKYTTQVIKYLMWSISTFDENIKTRLNIEINYNQRILKKSMAKIEKNLISMNMA